MNRYIFMIVLSILTIMLAQHTVVAQAACQPTPHYKHHKKHSPHIEHYRTCENDDHDLATGDDDACTYSDLQID